MPKFKPILPKTEYDVGYGKPPKETKFQKGRSGNPTGRPTGSRNKAVAGVDRLKAIVLEEAYREIDITEKGDAVQIPMAQAVIRSLGVHAAKGKISAQRLFIETLATVEHLDRKEKEEFFAVASDYKKRKLKEIAEAEAAGIDPPQILPHPDDIELNLGTAEVLFHGPVSEEDLVTWNQWWGEKQEYEHEVKELRGALAQAEEDEERSMLAESLDWHLFLLKLTALKIMRRWHLPGKKVVNGLLLARLLDQHVEQGTNPEPTGTKVPEPVDWEDAFQRHEKYLRKKANQNL